MYSPFKASLLLAFALIVSGGSSPATITTPTSIGQASSTTTGTTLSVPVPAGGVPFGSKIIVSFTMQPRISGTVSVADGLPTSKNFYNSDADVAYTTTSPTIRTLVFSALVTTALTSSDTITVTCPSVTNRAVSIYYVGGLHCDQFYVDNKSVGFGSNSIPSSGSSGTLHQKNELCWGAIGYANAGTFSAQYGFTAVAATAAGSAATIQPTYFITTGTGGQSADGILGTSGSWAAALVAYRADVDAPTNSSVTPPTNGSYRAGQNLNFRVNFSENVTVSGTPYLPLTIGTATSKRATYVSGTGTNALFSYTVAAGDTDTDGITFTTPAVNLNGGTIRDLAGNDETNRTFPVPSMTSVLVDTTAPTVSSVTAPGNTAYTAAAVPATLSGSAADDTGGVGLTANSTTFALQRVSDGYYWTGSTWQSGVANLATTHSATSGNTAANWASSATMPTWSSQASGTYTVQATATDKAGNTLSGTPATFTLDPTAPTAAITYSPSQMAYKQATLVAITAKFSEALADSPVVNIAISAVAGGSALAATPMTKLDSTHYTYTYTTQAGNGTANVTLSAGTDLAGNPVTSVPTSGGSFTVDNTAPSTAAVTAPASGVFRAATVPSLFSGSAADSSGGSGLNANSTTYTLRNPSGQYWTGSAWQSGSNALATAHTAASGSTPATWTSSATMPTWSSQSDGTYTVQATAADVAGNAFAGMAVSFTLDNTAPTTASVSAPANTSYTAGTVPASFSGSAADDTGGGGLNASTTTFTLQRVSDGYYWTSSTWQSGVANLPTTHSATGGNTAAGWSNNGALPIWSSQNPGSYVVQATATDKAGNAFPGSAVTFVLVNPTAATATAASPATTTYSSNGQTVLLSAAVTSGAGTVNGGNVAFMVLDGTTVIGTATVADVSSGTAEVSYALPAGQAAKVYSIHASYHDSAGNFADSSDNAHQLTVLAALSTGESSADIPGFTAATIPVTFVAKAGDGTPLSTNTMQVATTDGGHSFSFSLGVPIGTKTISLKPRFYLRKRFDVSATGNQVTLDLGGTTFLGGDVDGNNQVDGADYAWLRYWWGKPWSGWTNDVGTNLTYDINGDGKIDANDFPDLNGDGVMDAKDYKILKGGWYHSGEPE